MNSTSYEFRINSLWVEPTYRYNFFCTKCAFLSIYVSSVMISKICGLTNPKVNAKTEELTKKVCMINNELVPVKICNLSVETAIQQFWNVGRSNFKQWYRLQCICCWNQSSCHAKYIEFISQLDTNNVMVNKWRKINVFTKHYTKTNKWATCSRIPLWTQVLLEDMQILFHTHMIINLIRWLDNDN